MGALEMLEARRAVEMFEARKAWEPEVGDLVYLKSGSPALTVVAVYGEPDRYVQVLWMNGAVVEKCDLPVECIRKDMPVFGDNR